MHFYVDESGQTGLNLFDESQPVLYYGVLSSIHDLNVCAKTQVEALRKKLGVERLHANELGIDRLTSIVDQLDEIQKSFGICFDIYRINKVDHAAICFFDQVFDQGLNKAVPWVAYWTPLRYPLLLEVASLFDESTLKLAWQARIEKKVKIADELLVSVMAVLLERLDWIQDKRAREIISDALRWAIKYPEEIHYSIYSKKDALQISPNLIGFQSVLHGVSSRLKREGVGASSIVVDRQSQFNKAQEWITETFTAMKHIPMEVGPGLPTMDLSHMPDISITCTAGTDNVGLEIVDVYLWLFKRFFEGKPLGDALQKLIEHQFNVGYTDQVSLAAIAERWGAHFANLPDISEEDLERGRQFRAASEAKRKQHLADL
jgi:hypothetical protein